jgi:carbon monoxide dehydrogenase subunit G
MDLENRFIVGVPLETAWCGLLDIPLVVECLPGAVLTETLDATTFKGMIRVRLGPIVMEFAGKLQVDSVDEIAHRAVIKATWNETRNRGSAISLSVLEATANAHSADVLVKTSVTLSGQIAQYGRGVGIIQAVSAELVKQFADNLQEKLEKRQAQQPASNDRLLDSSVLLHKPKEIYSFALIWATFVSWLRSFIATR